MQASNAMDSFMKLVFPNQEDAESGEKLLTVPYESRVSAAKILLEIEKYEDASIVCENLLEQDDSNLEVWYLTALAYSFFDPECSMEYLSRLLNMIEDEPECLPLKGLANQILENLKGQIMDVDKEL